MITKWAQHLQGNDKAALEMQVKSSKPVLDRLIEMLDEKLTQYDSIDSDFTNPNWGYHQAFLAGKRSEVKEIKKLITLDHKENK